MCGGLEVTPFEVTRYPEHQVKVELLDTKEIELRANNSLIKKSSSSERNSVIRKSSYVDWSRGSPRGIYM